ncbi:hypothetical protein TIFTF001_043144 [Ficus carica]|uniref:Uncharacterized protein n=1 Tax=Ficus carica TaxID=3494 RepID=A0AA88CHU2_FICCA|nr:hypothetical protein TIFTF001_043144 [Ficus carica]
MICTTNARKLLEIYPGYGNPGYIPTIPIVEPGISGEIPGEIPVIPATGIVGGGVEASP